MTFVSFYFFRINVLYRALKIKIMKKIHVRYYVNNIISDTLMTQHDINILEKYTNVVKCSDIDEEEIID